MSIEEGDKLHVVTADDISNNKKRLGKFLVWGSALILSFTLLIQALDTNAVLTIGLETWRPSLYAYVLWAFCLCASQVLTRGEHGKRVLFVLPAALFVISMVLSRLEWRISVTAPVPSSFRRFAPTSLS